MILAIPAMMVLLTACSNEEVARLESVNQELKEEMLAKEEVVTDFIKGLESIQYDLRDITEREDLLGGLTVNDAELARSPQQEIMEDIALIDGLIKRNLGRITELELKVKGSEGRLYEFERVVANLKMDVLDKDAQIQVIKRSLIELEEDYADLLGEYNEQILISSIQDEALHEGYFAYGSKEELVEMQVAQKEGGILGIGATWKLRDDFNKEYFTEVDIRQVNRIPLGSEEVEILSNHPVDTYELVMEEERVKELLITDADRFWELTKYLAMVID